jgi:fibronectin-binding autotransporter adhesin
VRKAGTGPSTLSGLNTYTGGTVVEAGILTTASDFTMAGANGFTMSGVPSPTAGSDYGAIVASAGTLTYGGDLGLTLSGTATPGATYDLFSFSGGTQAGSFSNVVLGGSYTSTLSNSGGVWTGTDAGLNFAFTESTGQFAVSVVPEPVTFGLAGLATVALAAGWMRRRNGRHAA